MGSPSWLVRCPTLVCPFPGERMKGRKGMSGLETLCPDGQGEMFPPTDAWVVSAGEHVSCRSE